MRRGMPERELEGLSWLYIHLQEPPRSMCHIVERMACQSRFDVSHRAIGVNTRG